MWTLGGQKNHISGVVGSPMGRDILGVTLEHAEIVHSRYISRIYSQSYSLGVRRDAATFPVVVANLCIGVSLYPYT